MRPATFATALVVVLIAVPVASAVPVPDPGVDPASPLPETPIGPSDGGIAGVDPAEVDPVHEATTVLPTDGCRWTGPGGEAMGPAYAAASEGLARVNGADDVVRDLAMELLSPYFEVEVGDVDPFQDHAVTCPVPPDPPAEGPAPVPDAVRPAPIDLPGVPPAAQDQTAARHDDVRRSALHDASRAPVPDRDATEPWQVLIVAGLIASSLWVLYRRLREDDVLTHDVRRAILERVETRPGATVAQVAEAFDIHFETARHHLDVLVDFDLVARRRVAGRIHHFRQGDGIPAADREPIARARRGPRPRILEALASEGSTCVGDLADRVGLEPARLSYHLGRLSDAGLLSRTKEGRRRRYRLSDVGTRVQAVLGDGRRSGSSGAPST